MKTYLSLFFTFFKIGLFTFGGGYAMLPIIQRESSKHGWATERQVFNYYTLGQIMPGIISANVCTLIGYKTKGVLGALFSMLGVVLPSFIVITALSTGLAYLWNDPFLQHAFSGVRLMIPAILAPVIVAMLRESVVDVWSALVLVFAFILNFVFHLHPTLIVIGSGALGISFCYLKNRGVKK